MKATRQQLAEKAWANLIINITGESKSGKTHLAIRSDGPRYIAYLDRNTSLAYQLLSAEEDGFKWDEENEEYIEIAPVPYADLTSEEAERRVNAVWSFAKRAIQNATSARNNGHHGGTFIVDGALLLKGYMEKWRLGDSATLGYRAKRGERGVSQVQYAETNALFNDFVSLFAGKNIDLVLTWEGRRVWEEYYDDAGQRQRRPTNSFRSSGPENMSYAINAEVQTMAVPEDIIENNRIVGKKYVHKVQIGYNAFNTAMRGRSVKVNSFRELKELFLGGIEESRYESPREGGDVVEILE